jgi:hypothetical protein
LRKSVLPETEHVARSVDADALAAPHAVTRTTVPWCESRKKLTPASCTWRNVNPITVTYSLPWPRDDPVAALDELELVRRRRAIVARVQPERARRFVVEEALAPLGHDVDRRQLLDEYSSVIVTRT